MCVIIYKPAGKQMPDDFTLYQCYRRNPDGIGFATPNQIYKTLDFGEAYTALQNVSVDEPCIIHFRWATHGSVKIENCHPFTSPNGAIKFAHNGVLPFESVNDKTDSEIADAIGLNRTHFTEKKSKVAEIADALSRARSQLNGVVRAAFLKAALGGRMVKTIRYTEVPCDCGKDPACEQCHGTGYVQTGERLVTEAELPPNLAAQERWLRNYDADWLKRTRGESESDMPEVKNGIDVESWLRKELEGDIKIDDDTDA